MFKCQIRRVILIKDDLLKHSAVLFAALLAVHVCNMAYQMAVSRALPQSEYALLAAFLGALGIIGYPLAVLTTGLNRYSSLLIQQGRAGDVRRLLVKWLLLTGAPALLLGIGVVAFNGPVAGFLHLERAAPVLIAGAALPALFWLPVLTGAAQGMQLFGWSSAAVIAGALVRLALGAGFVWFLHPACGWAMLGHGLGMYASVAVLIPGLVLMLRRQSAGGGALPSLRLYLAQSFFIQTAFAVLMTADVVLVKHYLPGDTEFAYAATLGRIVAFMPTAVAMAMFPKVASDGGTTAEHRRIFLHSFGYTALLVAAAAGGCLLLPRLLLRILFGIQTAPDSMVGLARLMALAMSASALLNVVVQFLLAQRRFKAAWPAGIACLLYLLSAHLFHGSAREVAVASGVFNSAALIAALHAVLRLKLRQ